jgi:hypothetical protein
MVFKVEIKSIFLSETMDSRLRVTPHSIIVLNRKVHEEKPLLFEKDVAMRYDLFVRRNSACNQAKILRLQKIHQTLYPI